MATEYVVGLRNLVSGPARDALRDVDRLRHALGALEGAKTSVGGGGGAAGGGRARGPSSNAARNAAFRRLQAAQREEERFTAYRIRLMRKEVAERERAEREQLAAELKRIREATRAEAAAAQARKQLQISNEKERARATSLKSSSLSGVGGALGVGLGVGAAVGVATYIGGQALDTAQQIENARLRFTALLGSTERANVEIRDAFRIAEKTVFDPREVLEGLARLATNFKQDDVRRYIFASISDFVTASGKGNEGLERAVKAINDVAAKGRLQASELTTQLSELGLGSTAVYAEIATILKVKGKNEAERNQKVIKLISAGKVSSDVGIQAITNAMRTLAGGGPAGKFAVESSDTLTGLLSNISGGFATLFAVSNIDKWPALVTLKDALRGVAGFFSVDSKEGAAFAAVLRVLTGAAATTLSAMISLFTVPAKYSLKLLGAISELADASGLTDLVSRWVDLGANLVDGLVQGITSRAGRVYDALGNLATGTVETVRAKLGISSPSRVMAALGGYTSDGFAKGIEGGAARVTSASRLLSDAATGGVSRTVAARPVGAGAAGAGPNISISITLPVQSTGSDPAELARQAGPMIGAELEQRLDRYFGRLSAQGA